MTNMAKGTTVAAYLDMKSGKGGTTMNVTTNKRGTTMDINNFLADAKDNIFYTQSLHFYTPWIYLRRSYSREFLRDETTGCTYTGVVNEWTTFWNRDTCEEIITVPSNIKEISTWDDWEASFKRSKISQHSPVYRIIKAIFDGKIIAAKDPDDEYGVRYDCEACLPGYEIM